MRLTLLLFMTLAGGCSPVIDAQLQLIETSRHGVTLVKQSIDDRESILESLEGATRARLDAAFDAEINAQSKPINAGWIIDARRAYAAAIDALGQQRERSKQAADTDRANLLAIDQALQQLDLMNRTQLKLVPNFETLLKGTK